MSVANRLMGASECSRTFGWYRWVCGCAAAFPVGADGRSGLCSDVAVVALSVWAGQRVCMLMGIAGHRGVLPEGGESGQVCVLSSHYSMR